MSTCPCEDATCHGCAPDPTPFAGPLPPHDGRGHCPRHGTYPDPGCVGCPPNWTYRPLVDGLVVTYDRQKGTTP